MRRLDVLRGALKREVDEGRVVGAVVRVARRGKPDWFEAIGERDRETGDPMRVDAIFRVYSMTKPVTSVAVLTLLEQGRLRLSDPVSQYLPEFGQVRVAVREGDPLRSRALPARRVMTIQDLLRQTAGFTGGLFGDGPFEQMYRQAGIFDPKETLEANVRKLAQLPLKYEPGTAWEYGVSLDVAARIVEIVSGTPYDEYLARHVFDPIGMRDTGFFVESTQLDRLAQLYVPDPARSHALALAAPEESQAVTRRPILLRGGSGLVSTAEDYARFGTMLLRGGRIEGQRVLSRKTVELMTADHRGSIPIPEDGNLASTMLREATRGYGYGLGVGVRVSPGIATWPGSVGDFFWDGAASTLFWVDPEEDLVGVFMIQLLDFARGHQLQEQFRTLVYAGLDE